MATANFKSMADFPLIVVDTPRVRVCPECYTSCVDDSDNTCENCGHDISNVEEIVDECQCEYLYNEMQKIATELNDSQDFYTVSVESGYYSGLQFYVEGKYWHIEDMDNEESRDEFGVCRSKMLRRYKVAGNKIRRGLRKAAEDLGLDEIVCTARFSNGEAWYTKVEPKKPLPLKVAVKAALAAGA